MKTLYLVRHAKSSWDDPGLADHDRPLARRGLRQLGEIGPWLAARGVRPQRLLCSSAERARATAGPLAEAMGYPAAAIDYQARLYACTPQVLLAAIAEQPDELASLMLVGHDPELTELAIRLGAAIEHLPTCAFVELVFDAAHWCEIATRPPRHTAFHRPTRKHERKDA
ncbi:SixA phosphatase family protein [Pseudomonas oligotrophica]|uniref:SixA phosphatase family protein n=1 Tax=Pseudomonas oligotrophica TaxID=2912055 RepID=UPI001F3DDAAE|nr:histidine phosphatase family protein [Pseudomonas oligotrophica]MCF7200896.1 histidine phosphatase family protein [Pseudomonas oligotrophica]